MHPDAPEEQLRGSIARLWRPGFLDEEPMPERSGRYCIECKHPVIAHDWPKSKIRGCVVTGCSCGKDKATGVAA
jgi:hypothetical protein